MRERFVTAELLSSKAWKVAHEDMHHAKMVVDAGKEEYAKGFARLRYHCEYYRVPAEPSSAQQSNDSKSFQTTVTCPAYFNTTIDFEKNTATIFGCLAHISHPKRASTAVTPSTQNARPKPTEVQCKYCGKWCPSRVVMNRHVKEEHTDPTFNK
ncbi:hypothetical protein OESDEN_16614 [Oesophagostomum dentatum]|uniref:C2H2-type domain-containing protein n=1 Tax=Oesophagostomum dentatum TaxID=61180 RepID=A0A0B1SKI1_OESDE|nr:hypothetical protein OESDEN_16614 [Oesophagostomum dentatum]